MKGALGPVPRALATLSQEMPALFLPHDKAAERFFDFFTANIRNRNTRRAYYKAACRFADWCERRGLVDLAQVKPLHVSAYVEHLLAELAKPTVKQHLAALRMLFDWLVVGHVLDVNPAHAVRGPKHIVRKGRTSVLTSEEARALLASINTGSLTGLRDRALIGVMIYTFARVGGGERKKKAASKTKYTCPTCGANAWAKPGTQLICGACYEENDDGEITVMMPEAGADEQPEAAYYSTASNVQ